MPASSPDLQKTNAAILKDKLARREPVLGGWVTFSDLAGMEIMSQAGFDFLLIDGEHGPITPESLRDLLIAGKGADSAILVRVAWNDPVRVKAALDLGAAGIMFPMINSPEEAARAVAACRYPPEGIRSVGAWRASNYYQAEAEYLERANAETSVIIQVEHSQSLAALDDILKVPGIDGVFIGPSDLAASLGHLGNPAHPDVQAAVRHICGACRSAGTSVGIDSTPANAKALLDSGANLLLAGIDTAFIAEGAAAAIAAAPVEAARPDTFQRKLAGGKTVVGTWITLSDPACMEIIAGAGFDFLLIDMQEGPIEVGTLRDLLIAGKGTGTALLVRVAWNDPVRIKSALDLGADGILAPMVNTPEEARQAVAACRYPPEGIRSVGAWRASNYYQAEPEYLERANAETSVIIQIEHAQALATLDEILAVPGIHGVFIGPSDLAASLGHLGNPAHPDVQAAVGRIAQACGAAGTAFGTDLGDVRQQTTLGMRIYLSGMDIMFLSDNARHAAKATRAALRG